MTTNNPKPTLDDRILDHLRRCPGSTAWAMHWAVGATREEVSKACQRLKRKGLVKTSPLQRCYWEAVHHDNQ